MVMVMLACIAGLLGYQRQRASVVTFKQALAAGNEEAKTLAMFCNDPVAVESGYCDELKKQWFEKHGTKVRDFK